MVLSLRFLILFTHRPKKHLSCLAEFEKKFLNSMVKCHEFKHDIWSEGLTILKES